MASRNVELFDAAHKAFNRRDFDAIAAMLADGFVYLDTARNVTFKGRDEFKTWLKAWAGAFSNAEVVEPQYLEAGDTVISMFTGRGKNDGQFGPLPATGKSMVNAFCEMMTFNKAGKITSGRIYYDQLSILIQLGHVPPPQR
jgi:steroid delta-isomerase-like uncharacterized protein